MPSPPCDVAPHLPTATQLRADLLAGRVTSAELARRAIGIVEATNPAIRAMCHGMAAEAIVEAATRDEWLQQASESTEGLPLLCGLPVTVKDCFDVAGTPSTLGIAARAGDLAAVDSPLVARLRAAGAVIIGKGNVPQAMMLHSCDNPLYGRTQHPQNPTRGPGGSSGGDAALVALGAAAVSLGSDLGGSIRQPAHACGIAGLKPTSGRLTNVGCQRGLQGMTALAIQPGPLARTVADLDLAMRALVDKRQVPTQADEVDRPWPDYRAVDIAGLTIVSWPSDDWFPAAPAIVAAIGEATETLRQQGATIAAPPPFGMAETMRLYFGLISADGLRSIKRLIGRGPIDWQLRRQLWLGRVPRWLRLLLAGLLRLCGQRHLARLLALSGPRSADSYWQLTALAEAYRERFWQQLDRHAGRPVDAILMPPHALPALRHGTSLDLLGAACYCYLPNLLGAPAGVVPWRTIGPDEQVYLHGRRVDVVDMLSRRTMAASQGLPIGLQVVARDWREDVVLSLMERLEAIRGSR